MSVDDVVKKVNGMTYDEISRLAVDIPPGFTSRVNEKATDILYDRAECEALKIPYADIELKHVYKARLVAYLIISENKEGVPKPGWYF